MISISFHPRWWKIDFHFSKSVSTKSKILFKSGISHPSDGEDIWLNANKKSGIYVDREKDGLSRLHALIL